jgi:hypothetical protein
VDQLTGHVVGPAGAGPGGVIPGIAVAEAAERAPDALDELLAAAVKAKEEKP